MQVIVAARMGLTCRLFGTAVAGKTGRLRTCHLRGAFAKGSRAAPYRGEKWHWAPLRQEGVAGAVCLETKSKHRRKSPIHPHGWPENPASVQHVRFSGRKECEAPAPRGGRQASGARPPGLSEFRGPGTCWSGRPPPGSKPPAEIVAACSRLHGADQGQGRTAGRVATGDAATANGGSCACTAVSTGQRACCDPVSWSPPQAIPVRRVSASSLHPHL